MNGERVGTLDVVKGFAVEELTLLDWRIRHDNHTGDFLVILARMEKAEEWDRHFVRILDVVDGEDYDDVVVVHS